MTPQEAADTLTLQDAMDGMVETGLIRLDAADTVEKVINRCVATAKAEAKEKETRRCEMRVRLNCKASCDKMVIYIGDKIADDLLTTGGLKVEE